MKETAAFYNTVMWQKCRAAYKKSKGGLCERCLERGIISPGEFVHHKIYLTPENIKEPAITLNPDNLELLCRDCHAEEHKRKAKKRYRITATGEVISPLS